jgi:hypothetical protein
MGGEAEATAGADRPRYIEDGATDWLRSFGKKLVLIDLRIYRALNPTNPTVRFWRIAN